MKAFLRVPTEQYAYIEVQVEHKEDSIDRIIDSYFEVKDAYARKVKQRESGVGLSTKEFNICIDRYLTDGTGETEKYMAMSPAQQETIQCIKRAYKRLEGKDKTKYEGLDSKNL